MIYNACVFDADICEVNGATIHLASYSLFECDKFTASGMTMNMDVHSIFDCTDDKKSAGVHYAGAKNIISGPKDNTDFALFKANKIIYTGWEKTEYFGMVEVQCDDHVNKPNSVIFHNPATFVEGKASVEIDDDDCNKNSGNHNPGEGEGDDDGSYEETETLPYTYLFEDNWPATGDYDMNDLVIGVQIQNIKEGNKTNAVKIKYTLYATGATKQIGAAFQLDDISASVVSGAESGQKNAVIQLFSDAHSLLGGSGDRTPINTYKITSEPVVVEKTINFNTPIDGVVNASNLNLFIVTNGFDSDRRNEIHVAGYKGTDKASTSDTSTDYISNETGLMWALRIPSKQFATYPKETVRIDNAYEGFESWIKGLDTPGWYLNYIKDKVIEYNLSVDPSN